MRGDTKEDNGDYYLDMVSIHAPRMRGDSDLPPSCFG